ncbi:MAG: hypothetical protein P4M11_12080 [Candidatus Pacebacteria bacterium]|nr:hypothetical protein [Candidatus Paceibacterota bacterium]
MFVSCAFICNWYLHSWLTGAVACFLGFICSSYFIYSNNFYLCNAFPLASDIDERLVFVVIYAWAYFAFAFASYASEFNDRLSFYKNVRIEQVCFRILNNRTGRRRTSGRIC